MNGVRRSGFLISMLVVFASLDGMSTLDSAPRRFKFPSIESVLWNKLIQFSKTYPKITVSAAIALILLAQKTNIKDRYEDLVEKTFKMNAINTAFLEMKEKRFQSQDVPKIVEQVLELYKNQLIKKPEIANDSSNCFFIQPSNYNNDCGADMYRFLHAFAYPESQETTVIPYNQAQKSSSTDNTLKFDLQKRLQMPDNRKTFVLKWLQDPGLRSCLMRIDGYKRSVFLILPYSQKDLDDFEEEEEMRFLNKPATSESINRFKAMSVFANDYPDRQKQEYENSSFSGFSKLLYLMQKALAGKLDELEHNIAEEPEEVSGSTSSGGIGMPQAGITVEEIP